MSSLLAEAVEPMAHVEAGRVAQLAEGSQRLDGYEHLQVGYSITRHGIGTVEIEARLEDRRSGEVLERFVTWRRQ